MAWNQRAENSNKQIISESSSPLLAAQITQSLKMLRIRFVYLHLCAHVPVNDFTQFALVGMLVSAVSVAYLLAGNAILNEVLLPQGL